MATSSKSAYAPPRSAAPRAPVPASGHYLAGDTQTQFWLSLCGVSGSWCSGFEHQVWGLWASLVGKGFDSKHDFTPPTVLLRLFLCPQTWGIFLWWDPIFSSWWLFSRQLLFWSSHRRRWAHVLLFLHLMPHTEKNYIVSLYRFFLGVFFYVIYIFLFGRLYIVEISCACMLMSSL